MGYNTSVIVMNDAVHAIESDPNFAKNLVRAIGYANVGGQHSNRDVPAGGHINAATVIETHHADMTALVTFGGNFGHKQLTTFGWHHHEAPMQERMCKEWAESLGFRLVKKTVK